MEVLQEGDGDDEDEEDGSDGEGGGEEEVETFGVDLSARPSRRKVSVKR